MDNDFLREIEGKTANDPFHHLTHSKRCAWIPGAVVVGAGPSGLAAAACLRDRGIPSLVLERSDCIASLWQHKTYDRLKLHLPKQFCELPLMAFPKDFPTYPTKQQFVEYLEAYAKRFDIQPVFNQTVVSAEFDVTIGFWRVKTSEESEYVCRWLVVATGENAESVMPEIDGMEEFGGDVLHTSEYKSGRGYKGKRVLVVGCGNSGMEVGLDLFHHKAQTAMVVRDRVHILPRELLGRSTFGLSMWLLKWISMRLVDRLLLVASWIILGDTKRFGIERPDIGPIQLKNIAGKTPVLDVGTLHQD